MWRYLQVNVTSSPAAFDSDSREEFFEEFIREVDVALFEHVENDTEEADNEDTKVAELDGIIVRQGCVHEVDILYLADAHSSDAEHVSGYLLGVAENDFYDRFEVVACQANTLLIRQVEWDGASTADVRQLVRRAADQFDVDLVFVDAEGPLAEHFRFFFEDGGPFLIWSKAYNWPEIPKSRIEA